MKTRMGHWILWCIVTFFISFIAWAYQAELEEVTHAKGRIIPSKQIQLIQNLEGGILSKLLVQEGDQVLKGQALLVIDNTRFQADWQSNRLKTQQLQMQLQRLNAKITKKYPNYQGPLNFEQYRFWQQEYQLYQVENANFESEQAILKAQSQQRHYQIKNLEAQTRQLNHSYNLVNKELKITRPLVKQGILSALELLQLQRQVSQIKADKDRVKLDIPRAKASFDETKHSIKKAITNYRMDAQTQKNQLESELSQLKIQQHILYDRLQRTMVQSPVKGTVKRLKINTIGGVIGAGMDLLEIVPSDDKLIIEAQIKPADIAFLYIGQTAQIKFSAYDFAIFGGLSAKLSYISADSIQDPQGAAYYLIRLKTRTNNLSSLNKDLPLLPGMTVSVELLNGKKTVLNYLLKPIQKIKAKALRES